MKEIQGKSTLIRVSPGFELGFKLSRVDCHIIVSQERLLMLIVMQ